MSDELLEYMKSLNPQDNSLVYDKQYHVYYLGEYLGTATWTRDEFVGDSFQTQSVNDTGELINEVIIPTRWEEVKP